MIYTHFVMATLNDRIDTLFKMIAGVNEHLLNQKEHNDSTAAVRQEHGDSINSISDTLLELKAQVNALQQKVQQQQTEIDSLKND